jgi:hypothetical protein
VGVGVGAGARHDLLKVAYFGNAATLHATAARGTRRIDGRSPWCMGPAAVVIRMEVRELAPHGIGLRLE